MSFTSKDPHNLSEIARIVAIGVKVQRRKARGKSTRALEKRADAITERAEAREAARRKK
ncbi:hypothetical protein [Streptomyces sp. SM1]|uniref:hypothetical protein n=1 Tax=Streptomyces sp. SM1 TaxID=402229 RepID=UPI0015E18753|nr:hypothetical protein [Streptomyces sp. SM1]